MEAQQPQPSAAPVAAKKSKEKLPKKKMSVADKKPTYSKMVMDAMGELKDRKGSSRQAIASQVAKNNGLTSDAPSFKRALGGAIRTMVSKKTLVQASGVGLSGRFRINKEALKKAAKPKSAATKKRKAAPKKKPLKKKAKKPTVRRARKSPVKKRKAKTVKRKSPKKKTVKRAKPAKKGRK